MATLTRRAMFASAVVAAVSVPLAGAALLPRPDAWRDQFSFIMECYPRVRVLMEEAARQGFRPDQVTEITLIDGEPDVAPAVRLEADNGDRVTITRAGTLRVHARSGRVVL